MAIYLVRYLLMTIEDIRVLNSFFTVICIGLILYMLTKQDKRVKKLESDIEQLSKNYNKLKTKLDGYEGGFWD